MVGGAGLKPYPRHDVDRKLYEVRRIRVEVNEVLPPDLRLSRRPFKPEVSVDLALVVAEKSFEFLDGPGLLRQHALLHDLANVRRSDVDPVGKAGQASFASSTLLESSAATTSSSFS